MEDGRLVSQDYGHVSSEGLHILADEDSVLLGLDELKSHLFLVHFSVLFLAIFE